MDILTEIIGYAAAVFGTALMLPQVFKTFKTRRVDDISMVMLVVYIINCGLWETYGLLIGSMPMILCNATAGLIGVLQIGLKLKYQTKSERA
jgi:MtN3 and saliva related transmembrane protein